MAQTNRAQTNNYLKEAKILFNWEDKSQCSK